MSDPTVIMRLPMTKAAYKGLDTMVDFVEKKGNWIIKVLFYESKKIKIFIKVSERSKSLWSLVTRKEDGQHGF